MNYQEFTESMQLKEQDPRNLSPLTLAYLGDCVYELWIRSLLVTRGNRSVDHLNSMGSVLAKAPTQCAILHELEPELTEEELAVYRRGRNAKSPTKAKNATVIEYRTATGFEALVGFLYLDHQEERLPQLLKRSFEIARKKNITQI